MSYPKSFRKWRRVWLPLIAVIGFILIYALMANGITIMVNAGYPIALYPPSLKNPQHNATPAHQANFLVNTSHRTVCPGLLYFHRTFPTNTLVISLNNSASATNIAKAQITELKIIFSDGREEIYASAEKPLIKNTDGKTAEFNIKTAALNKADITIQCNGFFESYSGEKTLFRIFRNMKYRSKLKFQFKQK